MTETALQIVERLAPKLGAGSILTLLVQEVAAENA
jgi:hypothetical protein